MEFAGKPIAALIFGALSLGTLSGCDETGEFNLGKVFQPNAAQEPAAAVSGEARTEEREVEAPDVFSVSEPALWDGRPSLGGVWVAHPDVKDPERVIIRNQANGKFVVGALFRREREIPGPRLQVSSDAATELGVTAGSPVNLNVVALRREEVVIEPAQPVETDVVAEPSEITETPLDPIEAAAAAIDAADATTAASTAASAAPKPQPAAAPASKPASSGLKKPYIQVGIFSVEANADRTARQMRSAGMVPTVRKGETKGKAFWRVIVGPAATSADRDKLQSKIRGEGFSDAYPVSN